MVEDFSLGMNISDEIDKLNSYLVHTPYYIALYKDTIKAFNSNNTVAANAVLLPCNPKELICRDGKRACISVTSFCNSAWLPSIEISGRLKNLDCLYETWGVHKFPVLSSQEEKVVKLIYSTIALHIASERIYSFLSGWIDEKTLLIKNIIITTDAIEYVTNREVKKELIVCI